MEVNSSSVDVAASIDQSQSIHGSAHVWHRHCKGRSPRGSWVVLGFSLLLQAQHISTYVKHWTASEQHVIAARVAVGLQDGILSPLLKIIKIKTILWLFIGTVLQFENSTEADF